MSVDGRGGVYGVYGVYGSPLGKLAGVRATNGHREEATTPLVTYTESIRPQFRESDRDSMEAWFDLWSFDDVRDNAAEILERLEDGSMPCDDPWPKERIRLLRSWIEAGCPA
jgi:hypothetical protein